MGGALLGPGMTMVWRDLLFFPFLRSAACCDTSIDGPIKGEGSKER